MLKGLACVLLAAVIGACGALSQPTKQMTERGWDIVVTVFNQDGSTDQTTYHMVGGDVSECMASAREYGDQVRSDDNTVAIMCLATGSGGLAS